jgi:hypothetical protein
VVHALTTQKVAMARLIALQPLLFQGEAAVYPRSTSVFLACIARRTQINQWIKFNKEMGWSAYAWMGTDLDIELNIFGIVFSRALGSTGVDVPDACAAASNFLSLRFRSDSWISDFLTASRLALRLRSLTLASMSLMSSSRAPGPAGNWASCCSISSTSS